MGNILTNDDVYKELKSEQVQTLQHKINILQQKKPIQIGRAFSLI